MCLILFSTNHHPEYHLILAANRDEFFDRPAAPLSFWQEDPRILAGRDLVGGGTWMGVTRSLRYAAITNFRDPHHVKTGAPTRGNLVRDFLAGHLSPEAYLRTVQPHGSEYNGFNLLVGEVDQLWYYSSHSDRIRKIPPGIHGLSNHVLNTPWPKVERGKARITPCFSEPEINDQDIFRVLGDDEPPPDDQLPDTGVGLAWERILSPLFIHSPVYGTRCSSLLSIRRNGEVRMIERTYSRTRKNIENQIAFAFHAG